MHSIAIRYEVLNLLEYGLSQRKISALLGISRGFVQNVQQGRYSHALESEPCEKFVYPSGDYARCPGCGGLVKKPCLFCEVTK